MPQQGASLAAAAADPQLQLEEQQLQLWLQPMQLRQQQLEQGPSWVVTSSLGRLRKEEEGWTPGL